jgi:hypothetical protein
VAAFLFLVHSGGLDILNDKRPTPMFPRWTAWFSFWAAILFVPAGAVLIFKTGPFAWNGLIAFYIPVITFFAWLMLMSGYGFKASRLLKS